MKKPTLKLKGIYGQGFLECSCEIRYYAGGLVKTIPSENCTKRPKHDRNIVQWICPVCETEFPSKNQLTNHKQGDHAI